MKWIIGRLLCFAKGHKRGRHVRTEDNGRVKIFSCPRCGRETSYKAKGGP